MLSCKFDSCDIDLPALQKKIQKFAEENSLNEHQSYTLQIGVEELVYETLFGNCKFAEEVDLSLEVSCKDSDVVISLVGKGLKFNPFTDSEKHLGVSTLEKIAKKIDYDFRDDTNFLTVTI